MLKLKNESLDWALAHVEMFGDTDIFPIPFEYNAIREFWNKGVREIGNGFSIKEYLRDQNILKWNIRDLRRTLTPKHKYGFRLSTQLDPFDNLIFLALIYEIGEDIEKRRVPIEKNRVFSNRFNPNSDGRLFNNEINYNSFLAHCESKVCELFGDDHIKYVVVADIADFFPRIYHHPLENALSSCTLKSNHAKAIKRLLNSWNYSISYGIPVGQDASRLLAELTLTDIDEGLLSEGIDYCRYMDDFRIFCSTEKEAYEQLAILAKMLFENHGLTLQQHKTRIIPIEEFRENYLQSEESIELKRISDDLNTILGEIGIDTYEEIYYDQLPEEIQLQIDQFNLKSIIQEQIESGNPNAKLVGFVLRRMAQVKDHDAVEFILDNVDNLYTSYKHIFSYLNDLKFDTVNQEIIGYKLIHILNSSIVGHLEYHRMWLFSILGKGNGWQIDKLATLYNEYSDEFTRRKIILALGEANQQYWFKARKRDITQFSNWSRRAFLAASKCLPGDEASHWYRSIIPRLDILDIAVIKWTEAKNKS